MASPLVPTRRCPRCQQYKPATAEHFELGGRGALSTRCRACGGLQRPPGPSGTRPVERAIYDALFAAQRGRCGSCGEPELLCGPDGIPQALSFYAHSSGARALICFCCDLAATGVRHDVARAARLTAFLGGGAPPLLVAHLHAEAPALIEVVAGPPAAKA